MPRIVLVFALLVFAGTGCTRGPGPHESERGAFFFWLVEDSFLEFGEACSDNPSIRRINEPQFQPNSHLMYRLDEDGLTATAQSCTRVDASTCGDSPHGIVFQVSGHELVYHPEERIAEIENSDCDLEIDEHWTLTDGGDTLDLRQVLSFALIGPAEACEAIQADMEANSDNGQGLDGCVATIGVDMVLVSVER